jgi:Type II CAAX prenyl endopeptidase Rce1-like
MAESEAERFIRDGSGPLDDLALTLPVFVGYHLGVAFLPVRNAADLVTHELVTLAHNDLLVYSGLTLAIGVVFAVVLLVLGRKQSLHWRRFVWVGLEGILYAVAMRVLAGYVVGRLHLDAGAAAAPGVFAGGVMSLGAGFYEELVFRVGLFGLGLRLVRGLFGFGRVVSWLGWAVLCALLFSGWHYFGEFGDPFDLKSFVFRAVCGLAFTLIYGFRGFAPAVWTHALYDLWLMVF